MAVCGGDDIEKMEPKLLQATADYLVERRSLSIGGWQLVSRVPRNELYHGVDGSLGFLYGRLYAGLGAFAVYGSVLLSQAGAANTEYG